MTLRHGCRPHCPSSVLLACLCRCCRCCSCFLRPPWVLASSPPLLSCCCCCCYRCCCCFFLCRCWMKPLPRQAATWIPTPDVLTYLSFFCSLPRTTYFCSRPPPSSVVDVVDVDVGVVDGVAGCFAPCSTPASFAARLAAAPRWSPAGSGGARPLFLMP